MKINTLAEARKGRVEVRIEAPADFFDDRTEVIISVPASSATPVYAAAADEMNDLRQQIVQELKNNDLLINKIDELEKQAEDNRKNDHELVMEARRERDAALHQLHLFDVDRHTERQRADTAQQAREIETKRANRAEAAIKDRDDTIRYIKIKAAEELEAAKAHAHAEGRAEMLAEVSAVIGAPALHRETSREDLVEMIRSVLRVLREAKPPTT